MMHAVRLISSSADFDIMREASLHQCQLTALRVEMSRIYPHSSVKRPCDLVILVKPWAASQDLG